MPLPFREIQNVRRGTDQQGFSGTGGVSGIPIYRNSHNHQFLRNRRTSRGSIGAGGGAKNAVTAVTSIRNMKTKLAPSTAKSLVEQQREAGLIKFESNPKSLKSILKNKGIEEDADSRSSTAQPRVSMYQTNRITSSRTTINNMLQNFVSIMRKSEAAESTTLAKGESSPSAASSSRSRQSMYYTKSPLAKLKMNTFNVPSSKASITPKLLSASKSLSTSMLSLTKNFSAPVFNSTTEMKENDSTVVVLHAVPSCNSSFGLSSLTRTTSCSSLSTAVISTKEKNEKLNSSKKDSLTISATKKARFRRRNSMELFDSLSKLSEIELNEKLGYLTKKKSAIEKCLLSKKQQISTKSQQNSTKSQQNSAKNQQQQQENNHSSSVASSSSMLPVFCRKIQQTVCNSNKQHLAKIDESNETESPANVKDIVVADFQHTEDIVGSTKYELDCPSQCCNSSAFSPLYSDTVVRSATTVSCAGSTTISCDSQSEPVATSRSVTSDAKPSVVIEELVDADRNEIPANTDTIGIVVKTPKPKRRYDDGSDKQLLLDETLLVSPACDQQLSELEPPMKTPLLMRSVALKIRKEQALLASNQKRSSSPLFEITATNYDHERPMTSSEAANAASNGSRDLPPPLPSPMTSPIRRNVERQPFSTIATATLANRTNDNFSPFSYWSAAYDDDVTVADRRRLLLVDASCCDENENFDRLCDLEVEKLYADVCKKRALMETSRFNKAFGCRTYFGMTCRLREPVAETLTHGGDMFFIPISE